ncbi:MAG: hypothetical protein QXH19_01830 [Candidatus Bathyarchaeia archaeon]
MEEGGVRRAPIFFMAVIIVMLVMSLAALILALVAYLTQNTIEYMNVILSVSAIALSVYLLIQMRRKPPSLGFETLKVSTVIKCVKCNYESVREFERGDYVLKEVGSCPKCSGTLHIYSIFREVKEREKTY